MQKSLRNQLILSHMLPLLIIIPLIGAALVYVLETEVFLPSISRELAGDAIILTEILKSQPEWWQDASFTQQLLLSTHPRLSKRVMLISPDGRLLASSDPSDADRLEQVLPLESLKNPPAQDLVVNTNYSQRLQGEVVDVLAPVASSSGGLLGFVRVTSRYTTISEELLQLRYFIGIVMAVGLVLGIILGSTLAVNIGNPIHQVTEAVIYLSRGERKESLPESGPEEIRLLIQAVNTFFERLRSLEQSRQQLLANLVHELGRPLGALRMAVQVLLQGSKEDPAQLDELLLGMDQEMENLQHLLNDLAHLHEQVLGPLELDLQEISLWQWLPPVLRPWEEAAGQKGLQWEVSIPSNLPNLRIDPTRFSQIIGNLVSNAIKFTPVGGKICVSAGTETGKVWIQVSDTGPGIALEEQQKIFTPFYHGQKDPRIKEGMGLGLSIARDLVQAHQGTLVLDSHPGKGSQFTIFIAP